MRLTLTPPACTRYGDWILSMENELALPHDLFIAVEVWDHFASHDSSASPRGLVGTPNSAHISWKKEANALAHRLAATSTARKVNTQTGRKAALWAPRARSLQQFALAPPGPRSQQQQGRAPADRVASYHTIQLGF